MGGPVLRTLAVFMLALIDVVGLLIARRHAANPIGWIMLLLFPTPPARLQARGWPTSSDQRQDFHLALGSAAG
jgi:hypothetical protein